MAVTAVCAPAQMTVMGLLGVGDDDVLAEELAYLLYLGRMPETGNTGVTFEGTTDVYVRPGEPGDIAGTLAAGTTVSVWTSRVIGGATWYYVSSEADLLAGWVHGSWITVTLGARPAATYATLPTVRVGGESNYADLDATGHLTFAGNARPWRDELGELIGKKRKGSRITEDLDEGTLLFASTCLIADDWVVTNVQLNHDKDLAASIYPHLHWLQASATEPNWMIQYRWQMQGAAKTTTWTSARYTAQAFEYTAGTLNQIAIFAAIAPPSGAGLSDIVQFRILRDTENDSTLFNDKDALAGDAVAVMFDVHFMLSSLGSTDEYTK